MAGDPDPAAAGAVVVLGLPEGCTVGLDLLRYAAGPRFRGFAQVRSRPVAAGAAR